MALKRALGVLLVAGSYAFAGEPDYRWGAQGGLGRPSGDFRDTASGPGLDLGLHLDYPLCSRALLRGRFDGLFFATTHRTGSGVTDGVAWRRALDTRVQAWTLGGEVLVSDPRWSRLRVGAGLHAVRWSIASTSTLDVSSGMTSGQVVESNVPSWVRLGVSLGVEYRFSEHWAAEARFLSSPYAWEGERVHVLQAGLTWTH